jgi:nitrate reductase alpha subunit
MKHKVKKVHFVGIGGPSELRGEGPAPAGSTLKRVAGSRRFEVIGRSMVAE